MASSQHFGTIGLHGEVAVPALIGIRPDPASASRMSFRGCGEVRRGSITEFDHRQKTLYVSVVLGQELLRMFRAGWPILAASPSASIPYMTAKAHCLNCSLLG